MLLPLNLLLSLRSVDDTHRINVKTIKLRYVGRSEAKLGKRGSTDGENLDRRALMGRFEGFHACFAMVLGCVGIVVRTRSECAPFVGTKYILYYTYIPALSLPSPLPLPHTPKFHSSGLFEPLFFLLEQCGMPWAGTIIIRCSLIRLRTP